MSERIIDLSGDIEQGFSKKFIAQLHALGSNEPISVTINSDGGNLQEAFAIYDYLKGVGKDYKVNGFIYGMCASAATVVACAFDSVEMGEYAMYMIHEPFFVNEDTEGEATDNILANRAEKLIAIYTEKTGKSKEDMQSLVKGETFLDADGALQLGFINGVSREQAIAAKLNTEGVSILNNLRNASLTGNTDGLSGKLKQALSKDVSHEKEAKNIITEITNSIKMGILNEIKALVQPTKDIKNNVSVTLDDGKEYYVETTDEGRSDIMAGDIMFNADGEKVGAGDYLYQDKVIVVGEDGVIAEIKDKEIEAKVTVDMLAQALVEMSDKVDQLSAKIDASSEAVEDKTVENKAVQVQAKATPKARVTERTTEKSEITAFDIMAKAIKREGNKRGFNINVN